MFRIWLENYSSAPRVVKIEHLPDGMYRVTVQFHKRTDPTVPQSGPQPYREYQYLLHPWHHYYMMRQGKKDPYKQYQLIRPYIDDGSIETLGVSYDSSGTDLDADQEDL